MFVERLENALRQNRVLNGAKLTPVPSGTAIDYVDDGRHSGELCERKGNLLFVCFCREKCATKRERA